MRRTQCCIIKQKRQDYTENCTILKMVLDPICTPNPCVQQANLLLSLPYDFDAFLWLLRVIIVASFYLWNKAITPDNLNRCRLYMLGSIHYLTLL